MKSGGKSIIGIVTWDFLHPKGGMGRSMQWIAQALAEDFVVVTGTPETIPGLFFTRFFGGHLLFSLCLPFVLRRWIRRNHIDLLVIPGGPGGVLMLQSPGVPYVCSVYHLYEQQARLVPGQWWKKIFVPFEKHTYRYAAHLLSFNTDARSILERDYGIPPTRISSLQHAVDKAWFVQHPVVAKEKNLFVCVARLEARKGVDVLLDAWENIFLTVPDATLIVVGDGIQAANVDRRIEAGGTSVSRIAALPFSELITLVRRAEVAVCPSYLEGFGLAAAEAMACGTVVIAADSEGLRCLIQTGKNGFLFASGDAHALAEKMVDVLSDNERRKRVGALAQEDAMQRYNPLEASQSLRDAVHDVVTDNA